MLEWLHHPKRRDGVALKGYVQKGKAIGELIDTSTI